MAKRVDQEILMKRRDRRMGGVTLEAGMKPAARLRGGGVM
jgi:hypothetical protein